MTTDGSALGGPALGAPALDGTPPRLVVVDDSNDPHDLAASTWPEGSHLLILFWCASGTLARLAAQDGVTCHGPMDILGGLAHWERRTAELVTAVCDAGPIHGGQPWRRLIEEPLYYEAFDVVAILFAFERVQQLRREAAAGAIPVVELRLAPPRLRLWQALDVTSEETGSREADSEVVGAPLQAPSDGARPSLAARLWGRVRRILMTGDLRGQLWKLMDQLDSTYRGRVALHRRLPTPRVAPGGITFFSSYRNNSRNLKHLEDALQILKAESSDGTSYRSTWLVTNRDARLPDTDGPVYELYRFAGPALDAPAEPALPELAEVAAQWHGEAEDAASVTRLLETWIRQSAAWSYWQQRGHRALPQLAACWQRYLDTARPRLIVMSNQWSVEGWMTHMARRRGIPVLQMMHGILGGEYHTNSPVRSDAMLVQGTFWRHLWPREEQRKIHVLPLSRTRPVQRTPSEVPRLTYLSWPVEQLSFYNAHELRDGFLRLCHRLLEEKTCRIHILCHPREDPAALVSRWNRHYGAWPDDLTWGQGEPMDEVMARTDVALMYRSTTMLDCFTHGVPFVLPGWIDFSWRAGLTGTAGAHVAEDFSDLEATLRRWLHEPPETITAEQRQAMLGSELDAVDAAHQLHRVITSLTEGSAL